MYQPPLAGLDFDGEFCDVSDKCRPEIKSGEECNQSKGGHAQRSLDCVHVLGRAPFPPSHFVHSQIQVHLSRIRYRLDPQHESARAVFHGSCCQTETCHKSQPDTLRRECGRDLPFQVIPSEVVNCSSGLLSCHGGAGLALRTNPRSPPFHQIRGANPARPSAALSRAPVCELGSENGRMMNRSGDCCWTPQGHDGVPSEWHERKLVGCYR